MTRRQKQLAMWGGLVLPAALQLGLLAFAVAGRIAYPFDLEWMEGGLHQNSGWFQFGPRFCLDYMPFLILLIAVGARPLAILPKTLIAISIAINTFGA